MVKVERFIDYSRGMRLGRKMYRATLGEMSADGTTSARARESLLAAVETAISGNEWQPWTALYGENFVTVYRDVNGWGYLFGAVSKLTPCEHHIATHSPAYIAEPGSTRRQTIERARKHLAQAGYPTSNGLDVFRMYPTAEAETVRDHLRWLCFQRAYLHARDVLKLPENGRGDCHEFACNETGNPVWLADEEERAAWFLTTPAR